MGFLMNNRSMETSTKIEMLPNEKTNAQVTLNYDQRCKWILVKKSLSIIRKFHPSGHLWIIELKKETVEWQYQHFSFTKFRNKLNLHDTLDYDVDMRFNYSQWDVNNKCICLLNNTGIPKHLWSWCGLCILKLQHICMHRLMQSGNLWKKSCKCHWTFDWNVGIWFINRSGLKCTWDSMRMSFFFSNIYNAFSWNNNFLFSGTMFFLFF